MTCEDCEYWHFPTSTLYQQIRVNGMCTGGSLIKETEPDHSCHKHKYIQRPVQFGLSVAAAVERKRKREFGAIMNDQEQIDELKKQIDAIQAKRPEMPIVPPVFSNNVETTNQFADLAKTLLNTPTNEKPKIQERKINPGDIIHVIYKAAFTYVCMKKHHQLPGQMVVSDPSGKLHVFSEDICDFRIPK